MSVTVGPFTCWPSHPTGVVVTCERCGWHRAFATLKGAQSRMSEHALVEHRVRLRWVRQRPEVDGEEEP